MDAAGYRKIYDTMKSPVVHFSGGEPMSRRDLPDIIRAMKDPSGIPWVIVVSNASLLTPEKFLSLKEAGMHQLSLSIDFPDSRHDEFRRIPNLFDRMDRVVPECVRIGEDDDVNLNCCITAWNFRDLPEIVRVAERWGTAVNFSVYSKLRNDEERGLLTGGENKAELRRVFEEVIEMKRAGKPVFTAEETMWKFHDFLAGERTPGCMAGDRFLVINPDGRLTPCAMVMAYYDTQKEMLKEFTPNNTCEECYISTRAGAEKSPRQIIANNLKDFKKILPWSSN
jgi:MoaA/NifB/PqqE/SkfB family radical SAM enzyme